MDRAKRFREIVDVCGVECEVWGAERISTFRGGGSAVVFEPRDDSEFVKIYSALIDDGQDVFVLGGGSNVIVKDGFCRHIVVSTRRLNRVEMRGDFVHCGCGARVSQALNFARKNCFGGLEFLCGVPATIGGAIKMNAGAFSTQMSDYIDKIECLSVDFVKCSDDKHVVKIDEIDSKDVTFSYRHGCDKIVLGATLKLEKIDIEKSVKREKEYIAVRRARQPKEHSCGCTFKNGKIASAKLIDECGLKGAKIGGAQVSFAHANFIVNTGGATADDYIRLADYVAEKVYEQFGVRLEREFVLLD